VQLDFSWLLQIRLADLEASVLAQMLIKQMVKISLSRAAPMDKDTFVPLWNISRLAWRELLLPPLVPYISPRTLESVLTKEYQ